MASSAAFGLQLLSFVAEDGRLKADELREIIAFACSSYLDGSDEADEAKASHSASLLCAMYVRSRARGARVDDGARCSTTSSAEIRAAIAEFERFARRPGESDDAARERIKRLIAEDEGEAAPITPAPAPSPQAFADFVIKSAAKARGEVVELPPVGSAARSILEADAKARGRELPGDKPL